MAQTQRVETVAQAAKSPNDASGPNQLALTVAFVLGILGWRPPKIVNPPKIASPATV